MPKPNYKIDSVFELTPQWLIEHNIAFLLLDLDNTMAKYSEEIPSQRLFMWISHLKQGGIEPFILSNNRGKRPEIFAQALGLEYIGHAGKPRTKRLLELLADKGILPENAAIAGDQIFTDILCGNRAGIRSILVEPIALDSFFRRLRYATEKPYRKV